MGRGSEEGAELMARNIFKKRINTKELTCDKGCKKPIKLSDIRLEEERLEDKSIFYFRCPRCGCRYDSYEKLNNGNIQKIGGI